MPNKDYRCYAVMVKPVGSTCNLRCDYCYYLGKKTDGDRIMDDELLEHYVRELIAIHGNKAEIEFAWHGGEPTCCGIAFFEKAMRLQEKYGAGKRILNTLQTNGTLLNDDWCRFFKDNGFRIGISIDGPQRLHDIYRHDMTGRGTFHKVMDAIGLLQKHGVEYNTLTTVNAINESCGAEAYEFLRTITDFMQFLPVVERTDSDNRVQLPPGLYTEGAVSVVQLAPFSTSSEGYGHFLCEVFDCWRQKDIGNKFVQIFEASIGNLTRRPAGLCVHESVCGHCAVIERNGDTYRCDRYVFDNYRMGNLTQTTLQQMMDSNRSFGEYKLESLPSRCLHCDVVEMCFGGCPKDRIVEQLSLNGVLRYNYLCPSYRLFFRYFKAKIKSQP